MTEELVIPGRFNGPPHSGNGGYVSGALAALLPDPAGTPVEVTLRRPIPLDRPLQVRQEDEQYVAGDADGAVLEARLADEVVDPIEPVRHDEAVRAAVDFPGFDRHPFPTCFACGTEREDGLRIFPGPVPPTPDGPVRLAAPWTPDGSVAEELWPVTWAALDCIGGWAADLEDRYLLLGRMTGVVDTVPRVGEPHVVLGQALGSEGRKTRTAATLVDSDGRVVARALHTWIEISAETFARLGRP
ncbi:MAG TPA: hypothetical protein VFO98_15890 [Marmoricola sp.]|nr:hypothetical protein [Marmoricola sp.]